MPSRPSVPSPSAAPAGRWSSTRPRRRASSGLCRSGGFAKHFYLLRFARWHPASFFERPAELLTDRPAHRGQRHPHAPLFLPQLAVALECRLVVLFELLPQRTLLLRGGQDAPLAPR